MYGSLTLPRLQRGPLTMPERRPRRTQDAAPGPDRPLRAVFATIRTWVRRAYTDHTSPEHARLAEALILVVIVSTIATVLEFDPSFARTHRDSLLVVDLLVTACFALDYALNVRHARSVRRYLFGPWGIVDLLAILPVANSLMPQLGKTLRFFRFLRFLRVLKAAKELRRRFELAENEVPASIALPYEVFLVAAVPATLLLSDPTVRGVTLAAIVAGAASLVLRRWLVKARHDSLALLILLVTIWIAVMEALRLDAAGQATLAVALVLAAVLTSLTSWLRLERLAAAEHL